MATRKHFTLKQAQKALPLVQRIVDDIVTVYAALCRADEHLKRIARQGDQQARDDAERNLETTADRLRNLIHELEPIGCELKDPKIGLIDFPARHEDREVLLCWKRSEPSIQHWHEVDAGFAGRQPVSLLQPKPAAP